MKRIQLIVLLLAVISPHASAQAAAIPPASTSPVGIFAGGVAGSSDLAVASNSAAFRKSGGGLYLHNTGWGELTPAQKTAVLQTWRGAPVMLELGFGGSPARAKAWANVYKLHYGALGIQPKYIAANAFAGNNHPTPEQWSTYMTALRDAGVPASTLIMPTFEYQNFKVNLATLLDNEVSKNAVFQSLITKAGGIVLDTPSGYFLVGREENYRTWVVDAIQWTRARHLHCVVIVSPHNSGAHWADDAGRFLKYLQDNKAMPTEFAVENYNPHAGAAYPNRVGSEDAPNNTLGVALAYTRLLAPKTIRN